MAHLSPPGPRTRTGRHPRVRARPGTRTLYRGLAHLIMIAVIVQAAMIAWTMFGIGAWVEHGGVLDASVLADEDTVNFTAQLGAMIHGIVGVLVVPALALALLATSLFAKVPGGVRGPVVVVVLVAVQVVLGMAAHGTPWVGLVHAVNAFLVLGVAKAADTRAAAASTPTEVAASGGLRSLTTARGGDLPWKP